VLKTGQKPRGGNCATARVLLAAQQPAVAAALRAFAAAAREIPDSRRPTGGAADPGPDKRAGDGTDADSEASAGLRERA
jgi:hypothetical protein